MGFIRIIAGELRGRRVRVPRGMRVRPTADRVRESLFSILGERVVGAAVLDPFAGSGALGFEALSRGARSATFFEADPDVLRVLRRNAGELGVGQRCRILGGRAARLLGRREAAGPFDLVLIDAPYALGISDFLDLLAAPGRLAEEARVVVERDAVAGRPDPGVACPLKLLESRRYGGTRLDFYRGASYP